MKPHLRSIYDPSRSGDKSPAPTADVIFVHGLNGNSETTWRGNDEAFWPKWLGQDIPSVRIFALEYDAASSELVGHALPLPDRAHNTLAVLEAHDIGQRPLVFIGYSYGGLLVKQIIRTGITFDKVSWRRLVRNVIGIVFIATPHTGSDLVCSMHQHVVIRPVIRLFRFLFRPSKIIDDLQANNPWLRDLNAWFRSYVSSEGLKVLIFTETKRTTGFMVVTQTSADPGLANAIAIPTDADHTSICRLLTREDIVYKQSVLFISNIISNICQTLSFNEKYEVELLSCLSRSELASRALANELITSATLPSSDYINNSSAVTAYISKNSLEIRNIIRAFKRAHSKLLRSYILTRADVDLSALNVVVDGIQLVVPMLYDDEIIATARTHKVTGIAHPLFLKASLHAMAEIVMAGVDMRETRYQLQQNIDHLSGRQCLSDLLECGQDPNFVQQADEIDIHCERKFGLNFIKTLDNSIDSSLRQRFKIHAGTNITLTDEQMRILTRDKITRDMIIDKSTFYYTFDQEDDQLASEYQQTMIQALARKYPMIIYIILSPGFDLMRAELECFEPFWSIISQKEQQA